MACRTCACRCCQRDDTRSSGAEKSLLIDHFSSCHEDVERAGGRVTVAAAGRHWHAGAYASPLQEEIELALAVVESGLQLDERVGASRLPSAP